MSAETCAWPLFSNNHRTNNPAQQSKYNPVTPLGQLVHIKIISALIMGWDRWQQEKLQTQHFMPLTTPHTGTQAHSPWEIGFLLISSLSQEKTTLPLNVMHQSCPVSPHFNAFNNFQLKIMLLRAWRNHRALGKWQGTEEKWQGTAPFRF